jgi:hypothetical protein
MRIYILLFVAIIFTWITACKSVQPVAPTASYNPYIASPPVSELFIPVELSVIELESMMNKQLNGVIYEDTDFSDDVVMRIEKLSSIKIRMNGELLEYTVPVKIWSRAAWEFNQFGLKLKDMYEGDCSLSMTFSTKLELNPFWELRPTTEMKSYEWIVKPTITKGHITIPVAFVADKIIKAQEKVITNAIDDQIKTQIPLRKYVEEAWQSMHQPVQMYDDPITWLKITPKNILITPLKGDDKSLKAFIKVEAYTETQVGKKPVVKYTNLPNVSYTSDRAGAFVITVINGIDYDDASKVVTQHLKGETFSSSNGKKRVAVDSIRLFGNGDKLIIESHVSGSLKGAIYFSGVPTYDSIRQVIYMKNLDYEIQTKNALAKTAGWLLKSILLKRMRESMVYDLKEDMKLLRQNIDESMSNYALTKQVTIKAIVKEMYPKTIFLTPESLKFVLYVSGDMQVLVEGLDR